MLRITEIKNSNGQIVLQLEGKIANSWIVELTKQCYSVLAYQKEVILDLSKVSYVDQQGICVLKVLLKENVKISNCSLFLSILLAELIKNQQENCNTLA